MGCSTPGRWGHALALSLALLFAAEADAVTIDFDSLGTGVTVTNQFPEATFSSVGGQEAATIGFVGGNSPPNSICTRAAAGTFNCNQDIFIDFTSAVFALTFLATGDDDPGVTAVVDVFVNGLLDSTVDLVTDGAPFQADLVDLSGFNNVTRIAIRNVTDPAGLAFDDFEFQIVPEPSTALLVGAFLLGLAGLGRRFKA